MKIYDAAGHDFDTLLNMVEQGESVDFAAMLAAAKAKRLAEAEAARAALATLNYRNGHSNYTGD